MTKESWKPVIGYESKYEVSSHGRVRTIECLIRYKLGNTVVERRIEGGIMLSTKPNVLGYPRVCLSIGGKAKFRTVHQLVAQSFLGHIPCGFKLVVDHINNDKLNNRVDNLQVITNQENASKGTKIKSIK